MGEIALKELWAARSYRKLYTPPEDISKMKNAVVTIDMSQLEVASYIKVYISNEFEVSIYSKGCFVNAAQNRALSIEKSKYDYMVALVGNSGSMPIKLEVLVSDTNESYYEVHPYWLP